MTLTKNNFQKWNLVKFSAIIIFSLFILILIFHGFKQAKHAIRNHRYLGLSMAVSHTLHAIALRLIVPFLTRKSVST